jgi:hypothetical protein
MHGGMTPVILFSEAHIIVSLKHAHQLLESWPNSLFELISI